MTSNDCLILIPAYNEELSITRVLKDLKMKTTDLPIDILVLDDGSTDATAELAKAEDVKVLSLLTNVGNGGAVQTGFRYAVLNNYKYVMMFDADGQHDAGDVEKLLNCIENNPCEMVIGSRYLNQRASNPTKLREIGTRLFSWIASKITKMEITDCTSGFRIINRKMFLFLAQKDHYPQKYPDADFIIMMGKQGFKVKEVYVDMHEREKGTSMHKGILRPVVYSLVMLTNIMCILLNS